MDKLRNEYTEKILEKKEFTSKISMIKWLQDKFPRKGFEVGTRKTAELKP